MRDIKFGGKRTDNEEWVFGDLLQVKYSDGRIFTSIIDQTPCAINHPVHENSVVQYIGEKDKNNKEIYENYIVKWKEPASILDEYILGVIKWNKGGFKLQQISESKMCFQEELQRRDAFCFDMKFYSQDGQEFKWEDVEVIGNIFDNPELLKIK